MAEWFGLLSPSPSSANSVTMLSLVPAAPAIGVRPFGIAKVSDGLGGLGLVSSMVLPREGGVTTIAVGAAVGTGLIAGIAVVASELPWIATGLWGEIAMPIIPGCTGSGGVCCCHSVGWFPP